MHDFKVFKELFDYDFEPLMKELDAESFAILLNYTNVNEGSKVFNKRIRDRICNLSKSLGEAE